MSVSVVIAAGGTGGHLVPAVAIARALQRASPDAAVSFVGTARGLESSLVPKAGYRINLTTVRPFTRDARGMLAPGSMFPATMQARRILRAERASVVIGMGGYPSLPVVAAARFARVPVLLHEQNAIPGLANEAACRMTPHIGVSFPETVSAFGRRRPRLVGLPLREEIATLDAAALRPEAFAALELDPGRRTVLIFGGSIGAARLNAATVGLAERWRERADLQLLIAAGGANRDAVAGALPSGALLCRTHGYIERMDLAYAAADVVVSRGGASTIFELAAVGLPSILVPYPHARRREQDANAALLARAGAALVVPDAEVSAGSLAASLEDLLADDERRAKMGAAARGVARPHAADEMAAWALELAPRGAGG